MKCKKAQRVASISNWGRVTPNGNENAVKRAFNKHGPIAIGIQVNDDFVRYKKGILDTNCRGDINHGVVIVGYGYDKSSNKDYWIIKNSWGKGFGENGYIKMRRNKNNMCHIASYAFWVV
jgi:C1A family cysteine protease